MRVIVGERAVGGRKAHIRVQNSETMHFLMLAHQKAKKITEEMAARRAEHIRLFGEE